MSNSSSRWPVARCIPLQKMKWHFHIFSAGVMEEYNKKEFKYQFRDKWSHALVCTLQLTTFSCRLMISANNLGFPQSEDRCVDNYILILTHWIHSNNVLKYVVNKKNNSPFQEDHTPFTQTPNHAGVKYFLKIFLVLWDPILLCLIYGVSNVSDQNKAPHLSPWLLMRTPRYLHSPAASRAQLSSSIAQPCNNYSIVL